MKQNYEEAIEREKRPPFNTILKVIIVVQRRDNKNLN